MNSACTGPVGARSRDGPSSGAASWTDRERSERAAPQGRAKRVNPLFTLPEADISVVVGLYSNSPNPL
ncbi:hypothetical protein BZK41_09570 [Citrobacter sp. A316]|nr:hypothetical protein BZK41_09570 [Citrobacter sp. A316]